MKLENDWSGFHKIGMDVPQKNTRNSYIFIFIQSLTIRSRPSLLSRCGRLYNGSKHICNVEAFSRLQVATSQKTAPFRRVQFPNSIFIWFSLRNERITLKMQVSTNVCRGVEPSKFEICHKAVLFNWRQGKISFVISFSLFMDDCCSQQLLKFRHMLSADWKEGDKNNRNGIKWTPVRCSVSAILTHMRIRFL
jgi:ribosomal protein L28